MDLPESVPAEDVELFLKEVRLSSGDIIDLRDCLWSQLHIHVQGVTCGYTCEEDGSLTNRGELLHGKMRLED